MMWGSNVSGWILDRLEMFEAVLWHSYTAGAVRAFPKGIPLLEEAQYQYPKFGERNIIRKTAAGRCACARSIVQSNIDFRISFFFLIFFFVQLRAFSILSLFRDRDFEAVLAFCQSLLSLLLSSFSFARLHLPSYSSCLFKLSLSHYSSFALISSQIFLLLLRQLPYLGPPCL